MLAKLRGIFNPNDVMVTLKALPPLTSTVMDLAFPRRPTKPTVLVSLKDITEVIEAIPLVMRGGLSVPIAHGAATHSWIEPLPVKPSDEITGQDIADLKTILGDPDSIEAFRIATIDKLRQTARQTTEAMASTALSGKVVWPVKLEGGGFESYEVDYGSPLSYVPDMLLTAAEATLGTIRAILDGMETKIHTAGVGGEVEFLAGRSAWSTINSILDSHEGTLNVSVERKGKSLIIEGYVIHKCTETYKNPETKTAVQKVPDKELVAICKDAPGKILYCALDTIQAGVKPYPFFPVPFELSEGRGYKIIGESKPLPVRNPKSICRAVVTA